MSPCYLQLLSDAERTPLDSLRDRHVHHPKHRVYEADVRNLTDKVQRYVLLRAVGHEGDLSGEEGKQTNKQTKNHLCCRVLRLKERMQDLDKPLRMVNRPLWEEMSSYAEAEVCSGPSSRLAHLWPVHLSGTFLSPTAQIIRRQTEGEKQHLQENEQSSLPPDEGGPVLAPPAGPTGTSRPGAGAGCSAAGSLMDLSGFSGGGAEPEGQNRESGRDDPEPGRLHWRVRGRYVEGTAGTGGALPRRPEPPVKCLFLFVSELARVVDEGCEESPGLRCLQQGGGSFQRSFLGLSLFLLTRCLFPPNRNGQSHRSSDG